MKHANPLKRVTSVLLALVLALSLTTPALATTRSSTGSGITWEKVDNVDVQTPHPTQGVAAEQQPYADTDVVRVSIVLKDASTIEKGFTAQQIADGSSQALRYRQQLASTQDKMANTISKKALGGETLDVVWNLTLAANIISANVEYGQIEAIEKVKGVESVLIERSYEPCVVNKAETLDPNMATSSQQIGSGLVWASGYTGAGSLIAVIDTGTDTDHQSFDAGAFDYALAQTGKTVDLLTVDKIADVLKQLNAYERDDSLKAADLYVNTKLPFGYNYVDGDLDIIHDNDYMGEHGSHVAGIATANRYIPDGEGGYGDALTVAHVQGVAPDAQLITMKVFGKNGGAFDADYMAAIEDAIVLGADSINLSLGSANPGLSTAEAEYQSIMDSLTKAGAVVCMSAGNSGNWAEQTTLGYLYNDAATLHTTGEPGSYTNSLGVASVDNIGATHNYFTVADQNVLYTESVEYGNEALATLAGEHDYVFVDGIGDESDYAALGDVVSGKVVFVSRGSTNFADKANLAAEAGAVATIIYNNTEGSIGLNLTGYAYTAPCVAILQSDASAIKAASTAVTTEGDYTYYTGKLTIAKSPISVTGSSEYYTMSSFSSWGIPGSLEMKPEITAPGGNIYSVNGAVAGGQAYENMSGTSMASPQVAGMAALAAQYVKANGLCAKTGLSARQLIQSLLMSTAEPLYEEATGNYYSILTQGAGLANIGNVVNAHSYITMDSAANAGAADGKVKVELGEDAARTGVYSFTYTLHNLTAAAATYDLTGTVFTQAVFREQVEADGPYFSFLDTQTALLGGASVGQEIGGQTVSSVELPANGSVEVKVTIDVRGCDFDNYPAGAYIEAFVCATERVSAEGVEGTAHSIPVLGYYGSWTDLSMFDVGTYTEFLAGTELRYPYLYNSNTIYGNTLTVLRDGAGTADVFGGNPYAYYDDSYDPARDALSGVNGDMIYSFQFTPVRDAAASRLVIRNVDTGDVYMDTETGPVGGAFYYTNGGTWENNSYNVKPLWKATDVPEGDRVEFSMSLAPAYYVTYDEEGNAVVDWDSLGKGATISQSFIIDNTAPELLDVAHTLPAEEGQSEMLTASIQDNQYVAYAALMYADGWSVAEEYPQQTEAGQKVDLSFDLSDPSMYLDEGDELLLAVFDYAGNQSTYKLIVGSDATTAAPESIELPAELHLVPGVSSKLEATVTPWLADDSLLWDSSDESVATVDDRGVVTAVANGTATITASSAVKPFLSATCQVTVITIDKTLTASVWDVDGEVWISQFNTTDLPNYTPATEESSRIGISSMAILNGQLYGAAIDTSSGTTAFYTLDSETLEATLVNDRCLSSGYDLMYCDLAEAPNLGTNGMLVSTYGYQIAFINPETGDCDWLTSPGFPNFPYSFTFTYFSGITYIGSKTDGEGTVWDTFYVADTSGNIYEIAVTNGDSGNFVYQTKVVDCKIYSGDENADWYFNSLFFDRETNILYWSKFAQADNQVTLLAYEMNKDETGAYAINKYILGTFADGVWPVGGLIDLDLHVFTELVGAKEATCTEDGYTGDLVCTECGKVVEQGQVIPATDHDPELRDDKEATCTEDGYTGDIYCKTCGELLAEGEVIPATGHDYHDGTCANCGAKEPGVKTGDTSNITLWIAVMASVAVLAAAVVVLPRRKRS